MAIVPVQRHLRFLLAHNGAGTEDSHYIDIAKCLSQVNRRLYRQGKEYHIAGITIHTTSTVFLKVCVAPNTWVTRNAWKRGFRKWNKMNRQALDGDLGQRGFPRYHDYKVRLVDDARTDPDQPVIIDSGDNAAVAGEWVISEYESPDGTTSSDSYTAHLLGDHVGSSGSFTSIGLVKSLGETRATLPNSSPQVDSEGDDDPLANLFDAGTQHDEILQDLESDNDQPPYAHTSTPSGIGELYIGSDGNMPKPHVVAIAATAFQGGAGGNSLTHIGPFSAICGLIEIETTSTEASDMIEVLIELMPGKYKGVACTDI